MNDEEMAEQMVLDSDGRRSVPLSEWSSEVELQAAIFDRLGELINAVRWSAGGKTVQIEPWPTPVLAHHRVQAERRRKAAEDMAAKLWPSDNN